MRRALIVVGKAPAAGRTKTRLVPPLSAEDAAALYQGFLLDSVTLGSIWAGSRSRSSIRRRAARHWQHFCRRRHGCWNSLVRDSPTRCRTHLQPHLGEGFSRVVLIGSDDPTLPAELIEEACAALDTHEVSIGPSTDGGYYLIGLREPHLSVFDAIEWSTSRVYRQTVAQANRCGLRVRSLPEWYDVDEPADLERLQRELAASAASVAPYTRAALQHLYSGAVVGSGGTSSIGVRPDRSA